MKKRYSLARLFLTLCLLFGFTALGAAAEESHKHTGGTATCTERAVCTECGEEYGEARGHGYDYPCDTACFRCGFTRTVPDHVDTNGDYACDLCNLQLEESDAKSGSLSLLVILAIVLGALVLLSGTALTVWWLLKRKKEN